MPTKTLAKLFVLTVLAIVAMNIKDHFLGVQHPGYYFNLLVAWTPVLLLLVLKQIYNTGGTGDPKFVLVFGAWMLFSPNSAYLILDPILHVRNFIDLLAYVPSCILGVALSISMFKEIEDMLIIPNSDETVASAILLAVFYTVSFGVYLGLFGRWNSWDIFIRPVQLIAWAAANIPTSFLFCLGTTFALLVLYHFGKKYINPSLTR